MSTAIQEKSVLLKQAIDKDMIIPAVIANIGVPLVAQAVAGHMMRKSLEETPSVSDPQLEQMRSNAGLADIPMIPYKGLKNAFYVSPGRDLNNIIFADPKQRKAADRLGAVFYDPDFRKAGIIGHELGHAAMANAPGFSLSKINQQYLRPLGGVVSMVGPFAGLIAGRETQSPEVALGIIGGSQLLGSLPTVINEAQASSKAKALMALQRFKAGTKDATNKTLRRAWTTYLVSALAPAFGIGTGYALLHHDTLFNGIQRA